MLFLHEVHKVVGKKTDEFEAAFRRGLMPALAKGDDARLLWYCNHAMGSGVSYNVATDYRGQGRRGLGAVGAALPKGRPPGMGARRRYLAA